ncbi:MAG TPA: hypothetical protein VMR25_05455, partial [Planctomycetaceae bacterium]|nr:hypothetical protein [Planctomycetaceae bacterium]
SGIQGGIDALASLRAAREKLTASGVRSIKSRIIERVSIGGRRFRLEGAYLQGSDLRVKLEFKVLPDEAEQGIEGSFLEVCDGTILWTRHQIGSQTRVTRRDVRQILNASKSGGEPNLLAVELGLGGLPALLASLERSMKFDSLTQEEVNGKKFVVIAGAWNDAALQMFKSTTGGRQTAHIPDAVRIYFEPEILFPRRIDFLKKHTSPDETEVLVELDFLDIVINAALDEHQFEFTPPNGIRTVDVTNDYLRQLKGPAAK